MIYLHICIHISLVVERSLLSALAHLSREQVIKEPDMEECTSDLQHFGVYIGVPLFRETPICRLFAEVRVDSDAMA